MPRINNKHALPCTTNRLNMARDENKPSRARLPTRVCGPVFGVVGITTLALSRERRESHPAKSCHRSAPLVGLQRLVGPHYRVVRRLKISEPDHHTANGCRA